MFSSILVPIDRRTPIWPSHDRDRCDRCLADLSGTVRLLNVLPMTPVMLAEYVPADFDTQQRQTSEEALAIVARESGIEPSRVSLRGSASGIYHEILGEAASNQGRTDRDDVAPAGNAHLFPRLRRRPCRTLRQMLGARGAALKPFTRN